MTSEVGVLPRQILTDIADAIREKKGTSELMKPTQMAESILSIQGGIPFPVPNSAAAHNCIFRGVDLSQKYTIAELSALVQAGDFSDIYIGDYYPMSVTIDGKGAGTVSFYFDL
jgi:hypothetical protein